MPMSRTDHSQGDELDVAELQELTPGTILRDQDGDEMDIIKVGTFALEVRYHNHHFGNDGHFTWDWHTVEEEDTEDEVFPLMFVRYKHPIIDECPV